MEAPSRCSQLILVFRAPSESEGMSRGDGRIPNGRCVSGGPGLGEVELMEGKFIYNQARVGVFVWFRLFSSPGGLESRRKWYSFLKYS